MKLLLRVALFTVLVDGMGALLTIYWAKFTPFECHNFTCQTPPFWLEWAMLVSFGVGVILPIVGIGSIISRRYFSKAKNGSASSATSISSIPNSPYHLFNEGGFENFKLVFVTIAFCFLLVTAIGLFILHWLYMDFYITCSLPGPLIIGVDCSNVFANVLFANWSIVTVLSSVGAAFFGTLGSPVVNRFLRSRQSRHLHIEKIGTEQSA